MKKPSNNIINNKLLTTSEITVHFAKTHIHSGTIS